MKQLKQIVTLKAPYLFFVKFLLLFAILYYFFDFYWGLVGVGGKFYSPFLDNHFNFIRSFSGFMTASANILLKVLGYHTSYYTYNVLRIEGSRGVIVNPSCLGWAVMSFWVAFVYANEGTVKRKFWWIITGLVSITFINISRIAFIVLANHLNWTLIIGLDHHRTFNILSYCCIFALMFLYLRSQKKRENILLKTTSAEDTFSAA